MNNQWLAYLVLVAFPLYLVVWNIKRLWLKVLFGTIYGICMYIGLRILAGDAAYHPLFMLIPLFIILTVFVAMEHNREPVKDKKGENQE